MTKLHLDFETRSRVDLKKVGAWAYALHPSTEILCMGFGSTFRGITVWDAEEVRNGAEIAKQSPWGLVSAHNAAFEYAIYNLILHKRYGWPARWDPKLWTCTMARAAACGLPLSLDQLTRVLGCKTPKDLEGRALMLKLSKPRKDGTFDETPEKLERLYKYNRNDVVAEMEVDALLPELSAGERRTWEMDLVMNRTGIAVDLGLCRNAAEIVKPTLVDLNVQIKQKSGGFLSSASQVAEIKKYLTANKVEIPYYYQAGEKKESLDQASITELLERPGLPPKVKEVILIRRQAAKRTSVAKYAKALEMVCPDGRVRGHLQYHGAHTGRWAGRLLQTHNFPQGHDAVAQINAVNAIESGREAFSMIYGNTAMVALSDALRGMIVAGDGMDLYSADFNAIEARGVFWFAGIEDALATYRRGGSPYLDMGREIYGREITKKGNPREYDISKRTVLGCGFGLGWKTFQSNIYEETAKKGNALWIKDDLAKRAVDGYRNKYAGVPRLWREVEAAAKAAVLNPGQRFPVADGKLLWAMSKDRRFLVCRLPSGRYLWYWKPKIAPAKTPWGEERPTLHYWGKHPLTGQWALLKTYGGALVENVVQATARDIMVHGMHNVSEAGGFRLILTVHDEVLSEDKAGAGPERFKQYCDLLCRLPEWAKTYPVAVEGWVARRYRK